MRFLLAGHGGFNNRGCEAIVRTTIRLMKARYPGAQFTVSSFYPHLDLGYDIGEEFLLRSSFDFRVWKRMSVPWIERQILRMLPGRDARRVGYRQLLEDINKVDAVISIGGDNYSMDYGYPQYFVDLNRYTKEQGKRLIIWAASIGPFPDNESGRSVIEAIALADLITVRETMSLSYLHSVGIKDTVHLVADPAFLLEPEIVSDSMMESMSSNALGLNVSPILSRYIKSGSVDILDELICGLKDVLRETGLSLVLVPHVMRDDYNNDFVYMKKIYDALKSDVDVQMVDPRYNACQLKYVISKCRYFIGARTHSTIASLSSLVPTLSIGYSMKSQGINRDIFGNNDYVINVDDITRETFRDKVQLLIRNEDRIRDELKSRIESFKDRAKSNVEYLGRLVH